jgi:hypothetical protein
MHPKNPSQGVLDIDEMIKSPCKVLRPLRLTSAFVVATSVGFVISASTAGLVTQTDMRTQGTGALSYGEEFCRQRRAVLFDSHASRIDRPQHCQPSARGRLASCCCNR